MENISIPFTSFFFLKSFAFFRSRLYLFSFISIGSINCPQLDGCNGSIKSFKMAHNKRLNAYPIKISKWNMVFRSSFHFRIHDNDIENKKKSNKRMMRIVMIIIEMEITLWSLQNINVTNWYNTFPSFRLVRDNYFEQFFFKYTANEQREWTRTRTNVCRIWCTVGNHRLSIATINYIVFSIECKYFLL